MIRNELKYLFINNRSYHLQLALFLLHIAHRKRKILLIKKFGKSSITERKQKFNCIPIIWFLKLKAVWLSLNRFAKVEIRINEYAKYSPSVETSVISSQIFKVLRLQHFHQSNASKFLTMSICCENGNLNLFLCSWLADDWFDLIDNKTTSC